MSETIKDILSETIKDILKEMKQSADYMERHHLYDLREWGTDNLRVLADRIEAANSRSYDKYKEDTNEYKASRNSEIAERLAEVVEICNREIACRKKTAARCEMCREDSSAGEDCPYNGEPCGCNSPTYGEFPSEKDCEPFEEILRAAKGENQHT